MEDKQILCELNKRLKKKNNEYGSKMEKIKELNSKLATVRNDIINSTETHDDIQKSNRVLFYEKLIGMISDM